MLEDGIFRLYKQGSPFLISTDDKDVLYLRKAVAHSDLCVLRRQTKKSVDFLISKLIHKTSGSYENAMKEIKSYVKGVLDGKEDMKKHMSILSYLARCHEACENPYLRTMLLSLHTHIGGLYHEHLYMDAVLLELSSVFYARVKDEKVFKDDFDEIRAEILCSVNELTETLRREMAGREHTPIHPNTEFLRFYGPKKEDLKAMEEGREKHRIKDCKEKAMLQKEKEKRLERCLRVHVHDLRGEIETLYRMLNALDDRERREYHHLLYEEIKEQLKGCDKRYEKPFIEIEYHLEKVKSGKASKRSLHLKTIPILRTASKRGRDELRQAKLISPLLMRILYGDVRKDDIRFLFDIASDERARAELILKRENRRISLIRQSGSCLPALSNPSSSSSR